jgi:hypothetical protein
VCWTVTVVWNVEVPGVESGSSSFNRANPQVTPTWYRV